MIGGRAGARIARSRVLRSARWWWLVAAGGAAGAAFLVAGGGGARPEPISISYGSTGNTAELYPGLHPGRGIRPVNDFGPFHEDIYIPPQNGAFSLFADIANNGTGPVTVESVSLPAGRACRRCRAWPCRPARDQNSGRETGALRHSRRRTAGAARGWAAAPPRPRERPARLTVNPGRAAPRPP